jgi:hypothetical protein
MDYSKKRHKQLVIRSQDLKNQGQNLFIENPEEDSELSKYNIVVEEQVFWTHRENFFLLMKNFLDNILDFDEFETAFSLLYRKTTEEVDMFIIDLKQIDKFQPSLTRPYRFASFIGSIFRQFEEVEDEYCTERDVKDFVKEVYLKSQIFQLDQQLALAEKYLNFTKALLGFTSLLAIYQVLEIFSWVK